MKKQGPPEPLSEEHFANLKRKKGLPVEDLPVEAPSTKKRRTSAKSDKPSKKRRDEESAKSAPKQANGTKKAKKPIRQDDSDEEMGDEFDVSNLDDVSGSDLDEPTLGDDFLGSDDDSVVDSDQETGKKEKFVFSDDEDEDEEEREEKLTAANIEGLSRKLDEKLAREAAENEAEIREAALQTNIDGDKPHVLDDGEEDELSAKTKGLLAPDLQMLRTRITDTIRVLEDFANLAEEGRSRAEYTRQLLKDICACKLPLFDLHYASTNNRKITATMSSLRRNFCRCHWCWFVGTPANLTRNLFPPREAFAFFEANEVRNSQCILFKHQLTSFRLPARSLSVPTLSGHIAGTSPKH
jgi:ribosomal RNA methyltransferase Nop2